MAGEWETHLSSDGVKVDGQFSSLNEALSQSNAQHASDLDRIAELEAALAAIDQDVPPVPDPIPEPTKPGMLVGTSLYTPGNETMQQGFDRRTREWGAEPELVRFFFPGMITGWPQFGSASTIVSFKPPYNDVAGFAAGKYDGQVNAALNSLPRDKKARRLAIYHEREDNIENRQFTFDQARAMDLKLKSLIDAANLRNGTNIRFGIILMGWTLDSRSSRNVLNYLPAQGDGEFVYDWFGCDAYPGNSLSMDLPNLDYTETLFKRVADACKAHGSKNWFICETGTSNKGHTDAEYDTMQAAWLKGAFKIARDLGCKGITYWDSVTGSGPANNYQIIGPKAKAAMGAEIKAQ